MALAAAFGRLFFEMDVFPAAICRFFTVDEFAVAADRRGNVLEASGGGGALHRWGGGAAQGTSRDDVMPIDAHTTARAHTHTTGARAMPGSLSCVLVCSNNRLPTPLLEHCMQLSSYR